MRDAAAAELVLLERRVGRLVVALEDVLSEWTVNLDGAPLSPIAAASWWPWPPAPTSSRPSTPRTRPPARRSPSAPAR